MRVPSLRFLVPLLVVALPPALAWSQSAGSRASDAVDVAIVVNTGEGNIADIRHGLADFFNAIRAPHEVTLAGLERPLVRVDYTADLQTFTRGANALQLRSANGAYVSIKEAAVAASRAMRTRGASRRVIIAVSDGMYQGAIGGSTADKAGKPDDLQAALLAGGVTFYQVVIASSQPPVVYPGGSYYIKPPVSVPDVVQKASGGRVVYVLASSGVPAALAGIASDINQQ